QDDEAAAREVLIRRVVVCVVIHVMEAEEHLPRRPTMDVYERRLSLLSAWSLEQLRVDLEAVARREGRRIRRDELRGRNRRRQTIRGDDTRLASGHRHDGR